jgi:hypothetical protein
MMTYVVHSILNVQTFRYIYIPLSILPILQNPAELYEIYLCSFQTFKTYILFQYLIVAFDFVLMYS